MHHLTAQWIPPNERSKFVTSYMGSSIGIALFYPLFGSILSLSSWEYVFHLTGLLGTVWYAAWLYFVYDSPAQHPRIDPYERLYIEKALSGTLHDASEKVLFPFSTNQRECLTVFLFSTAKNTMAGDLEVETSLDQYHRAGKIKNINICSKENS